MTISDSGPLTTEEAVEAALVRPLTENEQAYVFELILQASAKLRAALPAVDARIEAAAAGLPSGLSPDLVESVLADVIARRLLNPRRVWSTGGETAGPFSSGSETFPGARGGAGAEAFGNLTITAADLAQLSLSSSFAMPGTIRTRTHWGHR